MIKDERYRENKPYHINSMLGSTKRSIAYRIINGSLSASTVAREHNLNASTVRGWVSRVKSGKGISDSVGRPWILDDISHEDITQQLTKKRKSQNTATSQEFMETIKRSASETNVRRGKNNLLLNPSQSTINRTKQRLNAASTAGQSKTNARIAAEADPRNSYCEALMFNAFQQDLDPSLIVNLDATQYFSPYGNEAEQLLIHIKDINDRSPITRQAADSGELGVFVKSYTMGSAAGHMAPMVLVFADESMNENEVITHKFPGLSHVPDPSAYGYIAFTKTRAASEEFYRWFLKELVCPYFKMVRENFGLDGVYGFFTTDGEQRQIETFTQEDSIAMLEESKIIYGKHSASYSAKGNAFDAGNYFKATKARTKHMLKSEVEELTSHLRRRLDNYLTSSFSHITKAKRDHIADSCCRVTASCQKTCNLDIIKHGFEKSGQYVKDGFDFDTKMACCTSSIPDTHLNNMRKKFDDLTSIFREQGFITEQQLDEAGIISVEDSRSKPKDQRVPHQQRAMILNTRQNIERLQEYRVPEELIACNREKFQENAAQRKRREKIEMNEAVAKAKAEIKRQHAAERENRKGGRVPKRRREVDL
jgi:hypothetical protein